MTVERIKVTEIILLERIETLGQMGDVLKVRPGYARNYLLPQQKALRATKENLAYFQRQRTQLEAINLKHREEAVAVAAKMEGLSLFVVRQAGEGGRLYGSVTACDIAEGVTAAGFTLQRQQVQLHQVIKTLGTRAVRLSLHPEVVITITVAVVRSVEEVETARHESELTPVKVESPAEVERVVEQGYS